MILIHNSCIKFAKLCGSSHLLSWDAWRLNHSGIREMNMLAVIHAFVYRVVFNVSCDLVSNRKFLYVLEVQIGFEKNSNYCFAWNIR